MMRLNPRGIPHSGGFLLSFLLLWLLLVLVPGDAGAQGGDRPTAMAVGGIQVGVGYFGVHEEEVPALALELGYRRRGGLPWRVGGQVGLVATSSGSAYAYAGLVRVFDLPLELVVTPFAGVGAYHPGGGVDLGSALEFRTGVDLGRSLGQGRQISLYLYHLSNAGLGDRNPGVEAVGISYSVAIRGGG